MTTPTTNDGPDLTNLREFAVEVVRTLRAAGFEAYFAGGCVRDMLLGRTPKDYDVATSAKPDDVRRLFKRTLAIGAAFGVMQVRSRDGLTIETATFRRDGAYTDGRRPDAVEFCDVEADAARRDFTINGMYFDPVEDRVLDFFGGQADLQAGVIRAIGDPYARLAEDKLRLLRAVRFAARYGFRIESGTLAAIQDRAADLQVVSAERILAELRGMLTPPSRIHALDLLRESQLLAVVFPELAGDLKSEAGFARARQALGVWKSDVELPLAVAGLLDPNIEATVAESIFRRLKGSNDERERCVWSIQHRDALHAADRAPLHRLKRLLVHPWIDDLLALLEADARRTDAAFCRDYRARTPLSELDPPPLLTGDDLKRAGFAPGPQFKDWLENVRDRQLDGELHTAAEALERIRRGDF